MAGTPGLERAHAVDERVAVEHLATLARAIEAILTSAPVTLSPNG
jgi:acetylornithine deacetylase/succinyl-diaminopimelate desuccinylase-like protein